MYKLKHTQKIAFAAAFAAFCIIFKSFNFSYFGVRLSFSYIPNFLAGIFLGPLYGMAVGFTGDLTGTLLSGYPISPLILLGNTLMGGIVGVAFHYSYIKNLYYKIIYAGFGVLVIVTLGINTFAMTLPPDPRFATYMIALTARIPQSLVLALNTGIVIALYIAIDKIYFKNFRKH